MNKRLLFTTTLLLLLLFSIVNSHASSPGTAGFEFLRTHIGARPSAMGGAYVSLSGDIYSMYFNPAGLAGISGRMATATYLNHVLDFQSGFAAYTQSLKNIGQVALGFNYMNYGDFDETTAAGEKVGSFSAGSLAVMGSVGRVINDQIKVGASVKFIRSTIDTYSSNAVALDAGAIYHVPFVEGLNVGVGIFNVGQAITAFVDEKDNLPMNFVIGASKSLAHLPLMWSVSVNKYIDDDVRVNVGAEFTMAEGFYLRLGYNSLGSDQKVGADSDQFAGVSFGLGMDWRQYELDYAVSSFGAIGYLNRLSFTYAF
ncbi:MAG: PorV/PorQ family protein [Candidatus Zhuqueibacterota bacterium]